MRYSPWIHFWKCVNVLKFTSEHHWVFDEHDEELTAPYCKVCGRKGKMVRKWGSEDHNGDLHWEVVEL